MVVVVHNQVVLFFFLGGGVIKPHVKRHVTFIFLFNFLSSHDKGKGDSLIAHVYVPT